MNNSMSKTNTSFNHRNKKNQSNFSNLDDFSFNDILIREMGPNFIYPSTKGNPESTSSNRIQVSAITIGNNLKNVNTENQSIGNNNAAHHLTQNISVAPTSYHNQNSNFNALNSSGLNLNTSNGGVEAQFQNTFYEGQ